jgi:hypothetical protein
MFAYLLRKIEAFKANRVELERAFSASLNFFAKLRAYIEDDTLYAPFLLRESFTNDNKKHEMKKTCVFNIK